jgi:thiol-disulfide isomerase/thioredoxin
MATVNGVNALVAVMDGDNNAIFNKSDMWSVLAASDSAAEKRVLSLDEARPMNRLMFISAGEGEIPIEFRSISADGRSIDFAVVKRRLTKSADRAPDDLLRDERPRPRTTVPFVWGHGNRDFTAALATAKKTGARIILDFEATWCGPCHTMDQWIWNDAEVAGELNAGFIGVKLDVDIEKGLVKRFGTTGYPTMILLDSSGKEYKRVADYQSSREMLALLRIR